MRPTLFSLVLLVLLAAPSWAQDEVPPPDLTQGSPFNPPLSSKIWDDFSLANLSSKGHKFLGYATVTLGAAAVLVKKLEGDAEGQASPAHRLLGQSAGIAAGTTVVAGLVAHFDKLSFSGDLFSWHNLHALTAVTGASLMGAGAVVGGSEAHSNLAIAGTLLMGLAIILEG